MSVLMLLAALASAPVADRTAAPSVESSAVRLTLNNDRRFWPGDRARVQVEAADDGYLWVLQVDTEGRLRVLFPLDPDDDNYVQGGRRYELRGRGGRESFTTERERGEGFVYAAWQRQPFRFAAVQVNGHWDYRALAPRALDQDPEPELNELLGRVSDARWEYDLLPYDVGGRGNRVDLVSAPVVVNRFYQAPVNFAGSNWWRNGWCSSHWYGSVGCDPYRSGFLGAGFGGGWGDPYGDGFWNPYGGWGQDPWGWNNYGFGGGFGGGWYGNGWNGGGFGGGWNGGGFGGGWYGNGWNGGGFGGGWNGGGWNGGGFGGGGHGGGYIPPRGTNYEAKGRSRTWSGAPGPAASPVTFASGRDPRSRTGTSVSGPMPVGGPVREVDRTEGVGGRRWPLPAGFPVSRGSRPIGGQPGTGDDGTGGAGTDEPRPTPGRGRAAPDGGRGRDWDGAPPAGTPSRVPPAAEPGTGGERAPRDRSRNRDRDGEWTPAPRTPDRRAPVRPRDDSAEPRRAPEPEPYIPRPMPRDDQPARQPTPRDESRAPRPTPREAQPSRQRTPTDEPWAPRPTPRDEPRAAAPREEPREPARGRTWEPRAEPPREAPAPRREDPRAEPPRREEPRQEEPRREPPPRPEPQRQEPPRQEPQRQEPQRQDPPRVEPRREEAPRPAPPRPRARDWKRGPN